jgi:hypothetical protein
MAALRPEPWLLALITNNNLWNFKFRIHDKEVLKAGIKFDLGQV